MANNLKTPPSAEPYTLTEIKGSHLRIATSDDDEYIELLIKAARMATEIQTRRALITQTWVTTLCGFPEGRVIALERPPLISVSSIKYFDSANVEQTLSASLYTVDTSASPGRVVLNYGQSWPTTYDRPAAVSIEYVAGYGATAAALPQDLRHAISFLVAHWYRSREPVQIGNTVNVLPMTFEWLVGPYKVY